MKLTAGTPTLTELARGLTLRRRHASTPIPYVFDIERRVAWVNVGQDHDTASFAVGAWGMRLGDGRDAYPEARVPRSARRPAARGGPGAERHRRLFEPPGDAQPASAIGP